MGSTALASVPTLRSRLAGSRLAVCLLAVACSRSGAPGAPPLRVAAAADLARAFPEIGDAFTRQSGRPVTFSFGSTGLLAKQIAEGAPFDVFAAAQSSYADDVVRSGACFSRTKALYARGRIVLFSAAGHRAPKSLTELAEPAFAKIAIANPDHAPYGRAAREALKAAGVLEAVEPKLVFGENVQQAFQFARTGNADAAIVALSIAEGGTVLRIDPRLHAPIDQALVVCGHGEPPADAVAFAELVNSETGRAVMRRYGFLLPGESDPSSE